MEVSDVFREFQSVLFQFGVGIGGRSRGAENSMIMGTWSEPVEGREPPSFGRRERWPNWQKRCQGP